MGINGTHFSVPFGHMKRGGCLGSHPQGFRHVWTELTEHGAACAAGTLGVMPASTHFLIFPLLYIVKTLHPLEPARLHFSLLLPEKDLSQVYFMWS